MDGGFPVFYVNEKYRDKRDGFTVMAVLISFVVVSIITMMIIAATELCKHSFSCFLHPLL